VPYIEEYSTKSRTFAHSVCTAKQILSLDLNVTTVGAHLISSGSCSSCGWHNS